MEHHCKSVQGAQFSVLDMKKIRVNLGTVAQVMVPIGMLFYLKIPLCEYTIC
jgi:hypothetical protein